MDKAKLKAIIISKLGMVARKYGVNEAITDSGLGKYDTLVFDVKRNEAYLYSRAGKTTINLDDITEQELFEVASFVQDNFQTLEVRTMLDETPADEKEIDFVIEPLPIIVGEAEVGSIGVASDGEAGEVAQNVGIILNSDGVFPITVFDENDPDDVAYAVEELLAIQNAIGVLVEKISERNILLNGTEEEKARFLGETSGEEAPKEEEFLDLGDDEEI